MTKEKYSIKDLLRIAIAPALGCTEPAAIALCTASARALLKNEEIIHIELGVDSNVYKNGMAVAIPGTDGAFGIDLAAALGVVCGDPGLKLEVLDPVNDEALEEAKNYINNNKVSITLLNEKRGIYIKCILRSEKNKAEAIIEGQHDNLTSLSLNGQEIEVHPLLSRIKRDKNDLMQMELWLKNKSLSEIIALLETVDDEDLKFVEEGLNYNLKLAEYGLTFGPGLGVGKTLERLSIEGMLNKDMVLHAKILTSAAADARMSGVKLPAMSMSGSGNHGITAILPIWAIKDYIIVRERKEIFKAMILSYIITAYIKSFTGRLSAVCGCSVAAGAGAAAGIAFLMGGNLNHISGTIKNLITDLAGVICDGAKNSCAIKLSTAAGTAVLAALYALHGIDVKESDGIIGHTPEQTMRNVAKVSNDGMIEMDRTILQIMMEKKFTKK